MATVSAETVCVTSQPTTFREYHALYAKLYNDNGEWMRELMLGDYERIKSYPSRGFSVEQPISSVAEVAYRELVKRGFVLKGVN